MNKPNKSLHKIRHLILFVFLFIAISSFSFFYNFNKLTQSTVSPEMSLFSTSKFSQTKSKAIAASCGFTIHGSADEFTRCSFTCPAGYNIHGKSQCGGACQGHCGGDCAIPKYYSEVYYLETNPDIDAAVQAGQFGGNGYNHYLMYGQYENRIPNPSCNPCVPASPETQTLTCPAGQSGSIVQTRTSYCPATTGSPAWNAWTTTSNTCVPSLCAGGITPVVTYINYNKMHLGSYAYLNNTSPTPSYSVSSCGTLPSGYSRTCEIQRTTSDGTQNGNWTENYDNNHTIWTNQPAKAYPYTESLSVRCGYYNSSNTLVGSMSAWQTANAITLHPNYGNGCVTTPNACGQTSTGTYDENGICSANPPAVSSCTVTNICGEVQTGFACPTGCTATSSSSNSTCIKDFVVDTDTINPNGSVNFTWNVTQQPNYSASCGFVDLTTPTPRPVPGLQNLNITSQSALISNIQITTRYCLICAFYKNGLYQGTQQSHQWIRVQKVNEN